ncbi:pterin-4-alpha-carbinolamine dehydratase [Klebsormidium nitens]|uniref:4a-hydroxytetrahydrobiopterin dehydratase n=1 Tax=Klebsormidium nitens TaxID=105231 RepID=A0A1Y1HPX7_KLENI|nr:pterin-4-alpha-carbinolamine dehydratase [Klebsormidium nitens]|eukprot:GAQ78627.1 pterin-4-alpha-carbinolamine dehydratase [Klebsormidium nitens]
MAAASLKASQSSWVLCRSATASAFNPLQKVKAQPSKTIANICARWATPGVYRSLSSAPLKVFVAPDFGHRHTSQVASRGVSMQAEAGPSGSGETAELASKRCIPCEGKNVKALQKEAAEELLQEVPGWELLTEGEFKLRREWKTKNFLKGLEFMGKIGEIAEQEGHHPDLHLVGWNKLSVEINTHSIGGLSENDFILAAKISQIDAEGFLRKKKASLASN